MYKQSIVEQRHLALKDSYKSNPGLALITDSAEVIGINLTDPFRTTVYINNEMKLPYVVGIHRAVGGDHDFPNPGDILCASLASCFETTIRMIANRLNIELLETRVKVSAKVDVRGTLMIDLSVPVGFQSMHVDIEIVARALNKNMLDTLMRAAEHSCVIFQTIKKGIPITVTSTLEIK